MFNNRFFSFYRTSATGSSATIFDPSQIGSLYAWWRADSGITLNGSNVASWTDRKNGHVVTMATASSQPYLSSSVTELNNQKAVGLNGSNQYLVSNEAPSTWKLLHDGTGVHVFAVVTSRYTKPSAVSGRRPIISTGNNSSGIGTELCEAPGSSGSLYPIIGNGSSAILNSQINNIWTYAGSTRFVELMYVNSRAGYNYRYGAISGSAISSSIGGPSASDPFSTLFIGANGTGTPNNINHDIAELLIYNAEVSGSDYTNLTTYLNNRYLPPLPGLTGFSGSNWAATPANTLSGSASGFWVAALVTIPSASYASKTRRIVANRSTDIINSGWLLKTNGTNATADFTTLKTDGSAIQTSQATIAAGDLGQVLLFVGTVDATNAHLYYKRAEVGTGVSMGGLSMQPSTGSTTYTNIGIQTKNTDPFDDGCIIHGIAGGTTAPTLTQVQQFYDDVKFARKLVPMNGVTTTNIWNAQTFVDSVGGANAVISGSLTGSSNSSPTWSW